MSERPGSPRTGAGLRSGGQRSAELRSAALDALRGWRVLLATSRPRSWLATGLPFLVAALESDRALTPIAILGTIYFLGPYNLLLHGLDEVFDDAGDQKNPRRQAVEGGPPSTRRRARTWFAIVATNAPFILLLAALGGAAAALVLAATVAAAVVYSAPPVRTRERPILDSATGA
ncbi:MAG: hypothetical protein H0U58_01890, partial [Chloroflexi bacterium]|nr:hypothetical protein [Chloroflexota bacterium]